MLDVWGEWPAWAPTTTENPEFDTCEGTTLWPAKHQEYYWTVGSTASIAPNHTFCEMGGAVSTHPIFMMSLDADAVIDDTDPLVHTYPNGLKWNNATNEFE